MFVSSTMVSTNFRWESVLKKMPQRVLNFSNLVTSVFLSASNHPDPTHILGMEAMYIQLKEKIDPNELYDGAQVISISSIDSTSSHSPNLSATWFLFFKYRSCQLQKLLSWIPPKLPLPLRQVNQILESICFLFFFRALRLHDCYHFE